VTLDGDTMATAAMTLAVARSRIRTSSSLNRFANGLNTVPELRVVGVRSRFMIEKEDRKWYSATPVTEYTFDRSGGGGGGSSSGGDGTGMMEMNRWPITKTNTILNIVPQGKRFVVERFGKLHTIHESGFFFAVPLVDHIAYVIDVRERAIDIVPQSAITRDNVSVEVSGNLFVSMIDPEKAAYGARNPLYSIMQVS
jgi:hypothetical protein